MKKLKKSLQKPWMNLALLFCLSAFPTDAFSQTDARQAEAAASQPGIENTTTTANHQSKDFTGKWQLKNSANETNKRLNAIENAVAGMGRFKQGRAREMIKKMTAPTNELTIADLGTQIKITRSGLEATVPTNGQPVSINAEQGIVSLRATRNNGKLILVSETAGAVKTTIYELSADSQTLTQQNKLQSDKLPAPIEYTNSFKR
jgi:hypothetical protein